MSPPLLLTTERYTGRARPALMASHDVRTFTSATCSAAWLARSFTSSALTTVRETGWPVPSLAVLKVTWKWRAGGAGPASVAGRVTGQLRSSPGPTGDGSADPTS